MIPFIYIVLAIFLLIHGVILPFYFRLFKDFPTLKISNWNPVNLIFGHCLVIFRHYNLKFSDIINGKDFHECKFFIATGIQITHAFYVGYLRLAEGCTRYLGDEGMTVIWMGVAPWTGFWSPETVEPVLSSPKTVDKHFIYMLLNSWLGNGLVTSPKDVWTRHRKILTSSFHFKILESSVPVLNEHAKVLIQKFKSLTASEPDNIITDLRPLMQLVALDVICDQAMGIKLNAQMDPDTDFVTALNRASETFATRLFNPIFYPDFLYKLFPSGKQYFKDVETMQKFTKRVIKQRKKKLFIQKVLRESAESGPLKHDCEMRDLNNNITKGDEVTVVKSKERLSFLDTLLAENTKNPKNISYQDINDEVHTFLFTGHESTTWAMTWAVHLLGHDPRAQELAFEEIERILDGRTVEELTVDDYKKMEYVDAIFKEAMRLYPLVPIIGRFLMEDFSFEVKGKKYFIPRFTSMIIFPREVHRRADHWPSPVRFIPERFIPSNEPPESDPFYKYRPRNRHPFAYIPFSAGPRNCIGQKLAVIEGKVILTHIIHTFKIKSLDTRDVIGEKMEMTLRSIKPIRIKLEERMKI